MDTKDTAGDEQSNIWNRTAGRAWVDEQDLLDRAFRPLELLLAEEVAAGSPPTVLDVGCGTGGTTLAVARRLGERAHTIGIDISEPMVDAARLRAEREAVPATFVCADAQVHAFEPGSVSAFMSRFGVMFFDDPVRAFANLRRAASDDATLHFIVWRSAEENPFMTTAERAAASLLPNLPARQPDAPGQFALANRDRVHAIVDESGWTAFDLRPIDALCAIGAHDLVRYVSRLGPVGRALEEADNLTRARVIEAVLPAFDPYVHGPEVHFTAACWMISARAGARVSD